MLLFIWGKTKLNAKIKWFPIHSRVEWLKKVPKSISFESSIFLSDNIYYVNYREMHNPKLEIHN